MNDYNEAMYGDILETFGIKIPEKNDNGELKKKYLESSAGHCAESFIDGIKKSADTPFIRTGFRKLDEVLDGGLYEGLYIFGAISSLGKTTLVTQVADQIAENGNDALVFSLEMGRNEIIAKSISRLTVTGGDTSLAKTAREITTTSRWEKYVEEEKKVIKNAAARYSELAKRIFISEGLGDIGTRQIREAIKKHVSFTGNSPVVIVDYIQILAPNSEKASDKQNMDKAVTELKRISRDYKIPVIGISSFNRANYKNAVTMEAFKESGAIEYSSDVLIGLQLKGAGNGDFDVDAAKGRNPREVELKVLKNRNGRTGGTVEMAYYAGFNYFKEV